MAGHGWPGMAAGGTASLLLGHSRLKNGFASLAYGPGHPYFFVEIPKTWTPVIKPGTTGC
ncbi:MAG: hypothetical protein BGO16_10350 [Nitrobacter sp. 62-23]|nr:MAG: hypothetical protein BGO16_10350 [Nitrobacter sp. 62-23]